jgi:hypothetical protein
MFFTLLILFNTSSLFILIKERIIVSLSILKNFPIQTTIGKNDFVRVPLILLETGVLFPEIIAITKIKVVIKINATNDKTIRLKIIPAIEEKLPIPLYEIYPKNIKKEMTKKDAERSKEIKIRFLSLFLVSKLFFSVNKTELSVLSSFSKNFTVF